MSYVSHTVILTFDRCLEQSDFLKAIPPEYLEYDIVTTSSTVLLFNMTTEEICGDLCILRCFVGEEGMADRTL